MTSDQCFERVTLDVWVAEQLKEHVRRLLGLHPRESEDQPLAAGPEARITCEREELGREVVGREKPEGVADHPAQRIGAGREQVEERTRGLSRPRIRERADDALLDVGRVPSGSYERGERGRRARTPAAS